MQHFEMTNLGEVNYYLKVRFIYLEKGIFMSQEDYTTKTLELFGFAKCNSCQTPMSENVKLFPNMGAFEVDSYLYQKMIGKLFYLTNSRLDISYSIRVFSRFMSKPQVPHLDVAKLVFRYLKGMADHEIFFQKNVSKKIEGFTNADWASDQESR
jgi:hypothetical protein